MKIYTRTGDKGLTSLGPGRRVKKSDLKIEILGSLDEANCLLGVAKNFVKIKRTKVILTQIQNSLFSLGAEISQGRKGTFKIINSADVKNIEKEIDRADEKLPPLKNFILPGGAPGAAFLHLARAVVRRAERNLSKDFSLTKKNRLLLAFVNRLSDLLFVFARAENRKARQPETYWPKYENKKPAASRPRFFVPL